VKHQTTWLILGSTLLAVIYQIATPYMVVASFAYFCMVFGLYHRLQRNLHVALMSLAIITDLALVLTLQIQRDAIQTAFSMTLSPLQQAHIAMSSAATVLYFPVFYLGAGRRLGKLKGLASRKWHIRLGIAAFVFRTLGFILMFSLLTHVRSQA